MLGAAPHTACMCMSTSGAQPRGCYRRGLQHLLATVLGAAPHTACTCMSASGAQPRGCYGRGLQHLLATVLGAAPHTACTRACAGGAQPCGCYGRSSQHLLGPALGAGRRRVRDGRQQGPSRQGHQLAGCGVVAVQGGECVRRGRAGASVVLRGWELAVGVVLLLKLQ